MSGVRGDARKRQQGEHLTHWDAGVRAVIEREVARVEAERDRHRSESIEMEESWERATERAVLAERRLAALPDRVADFLLSYSGDGDASQPWQDGHNYAMREAARMVRERWFEMGPVAGEPHFRGDGLNGETTGCDCPKGADHDL